MVNPTLIAPKEAHISKRREHLPLRENPLWQIEAGAVRTYTLTEDGTVIALGFWGLGDAVGQPLALIQAHEAKCLTDVRVRPLQPKECGHLNQVLLSHLHQTQILLRLRSGQIHHRFWQLLDWLADQFGHESEQEQLINLRLTHQDFAEPWGLPVSL